MIISEEGFDKIAYEVDRLLDASNNKLIHYTSRYLEFISKVIPNVEIVCLTYRDGINLVGFLPLAIKHDLVLGSAVNSLPYFGSHGGVIVSHSCENVEVVIQALLDYLQSYCKAKDVVSITLVENPLHPVDESLYNSIGLKCVDDRVGQLTILPDVTIKNPEDELFSKFHVKTRNAVRKGQKHFGRLEERRDDATLIWMQGVHEKSITSMGGVSKSLAHFMAIREIFGDDMRIYICEVNGLPVAGILLLLYKKTVEYFIPVITEDFKEKQILSALIFEAMLALSKEGYSLWNWGGTWRTQKGVYRFKNRWGASDSVYRYYNHLANTDIINVPRAELVSAFPHFYLFKY